MKYPGSIFGFKLIFGSIYNVVMDDTKCYLCKENIVTEING